MKKKILLVDDDQIHHFIHTKVIERAGIDCDISTASNGDEALEMIRGHLAGIVFTPDIILLDLDMPIMNGFEFIKIFQQMEIPNKDNIVIVILTSSMNIADVEKARSIGIQRFLTKPLTTQDVSKLFASIVQKV
jgi:CheY-like chemotaxis protein